MPTSLPRWPLASAALASALALAPTTQAQPAPADAELTASPTTPSAAPSAPADENADELQELRERVRKLEERLAEVTGKLEEDELADIIREAEAEAEAEAPDEEQRPEEREFLWGALALQKLNPEISVSGDFLAGVILNETKFYSGPTERSGFLLRALGVHLQHQLDPYSTFKGALDIAPDFTGEGIVSLEELYVTWHGLIESTSLTVGAFRQNFGVVNRWHEHDLDQVDFPLPIRLLFGPTGLAQTGISFKWFMPPVIADANELTLEITNGQNETLFAGQYHSIPTSLAHLKNYYDLSDATYLELGLSGMVGFNNRRGFHPAPERPSELRDEPWRTTFAAGADLTVHWSPPRQARYRSLTWRTEGYYVNKQMPAHIDDGVRHAWGLYSYLDYQLTAQLFAGLRGDVALPTERSEHVHAWDLVTYLTYWQSEFVFLRLQQSYGENIPYPYPEEAVPLRERDARIIFQVNFAAGPHKHEKY